MERKLQNLRCGSDLVKFNEDFALLAAATVATMGEKWVKNIYLNSLYPKDLAPYLTICHTDSLQQMMARAIEVDASLRSHRHRSAQPQGQNPDRHRCPTCQRWKHKAEKCRTCSNNGTGGQMQQGSTGAAGPRSRPTTPRRFSNEAQLDTVIVEEGALEEELLEMGSIAS